jgi:pescadillo
VEEEAVTRLLEGRRVFLAREVPRHIAEFLVLSMGGVVGWAGDGSPFSEADADVSFQIVDRGGVPHNIIAGRIYAQPQWLADTLNAQTILPPEMYAPVRPPPFEPPPCLFVFCGLGRGVE